MQESETTTYFVHKKPDQTHFCPSWDKPVDFGTFGPSESLSGFERAEIWCKSKWGEEYTITKMDMSL